MGETSGGKWNQLPCSESWRWSLNRIPECRAFPLTPGAHSLSRQSLCANLGIFFLWEKADRRKYYLPWDTWPRTAPQWPRLLGSRREVQGDCWLGHDKSRELMEGWETARTRMGTGEKPKAKLQFSQHVQSWQLWTAKCKSILRLWGSAGKPHCCLHSLGKLTLKHSCYEKYIHCKVQRSNLFWWKSWRFCLRGGVFISPL